MAVHGGAFAIPAEELESHRAGCVQALERGWKVLADGGTSLDAVAAAVAVLEDDPTFDAGRGSFLNEVGEVELDAAVMDGGHLRTGAVACVTRVANPIHLAHRVLESEHAMLVGSGAHRFAEEQGMALCDPAELVVPRELERWRAGTDGRRELVLQQFFGDTVGAVALDERGDLAAATSTGGSPRKLPGRVGDSPLIGAGLYADNEAAAVSVTGHGELIIPLVWAKATVDLARTGMAAAAASSAAVALLRRNGARAGLIVVDREGRIGVDFNTPHMAFAYLDEDGRLVDGPHAAVR
jgi:beta-aspartyl-peptidase (threonine type)